MSMPPLVALVVLNYNGRSLLEQYLPLLLRASYANKQVYVIDNASTDDSVALLKQQFPEVTVLQSPINGGYAKGYNWGLAQIEADYYLLLNSDVVVSENFLEPLVVLMESDSRIAFCQPKILTVEAPDQFEYAGGAGGWMDRLGFLFCRGRVLYTLEKDSGQYNTVSDIFWASGACLMVRPAVFRSLGGFYEDLFMYFEEVDLCWRAAAAGYSIKCGPASVVYHHRSQELAKAAPHRIYGLFLHSLIVCYRNLPGPTAFWVLSIRFLLNGVAFAQFCVNGHFRAAGQVVRAQAGFLRWISSTPSKAETVRPLSSLAGVYNGSVLVAYYLRGKRRFSQLLSPDKL